MRRRRHWNVLLCTVLVASLLSGCTVRTFGKGGLTLNGQGRVVMMAHPCEDGHFFAEARLSGWKEGAEYSADLIRWSKPREKSSVISWVIDEVPGTMWKKGNGSVDLADLEPTTKYMVVVSEGGRDDLFAQVLIEFDSELLAKLVPDQLILTDGSFMSEEDFMAGDACRMPDPEWDQKDR